jgi:chromosome segregation ATPase
MTSTRYLFARLGQAFGIHRRNQRMGDAASETHLLRDAEAHLGSMIWEKVEPIEELSVEYWNLRKLLKERNAVAGRLNLAEERLRIAHDERAALLTTHSEPQQDLIDERQAILKHIEGLSRKRDEIVHEAKNVRRKYDGLKMKLEVLTRDFEASATPVEADAIRQKLAELKLGFSDLKNARSEIALEIESGDAAIDALDAKLELQKKAKRQEASKAFQVIGDVNKEISSLRAELGLLDTQMRQLQSEIGRHVSRNVQTSPACAEAAREQRGLVDVMRALRQSIALNHRLAGMS